MDFPDLPVEDLTVEDNNNNVPVRKTLKDYFKEYHSIDIGKGHVAKKFHKAEDQTRWIALEKIHGSNFSFLCDGKEIVCCRRNATLDPFESFYGFQQVRDKIKDKIFELFSQIQKKLADAAVISVYGELFGGVYPHPQVKDEGCQPIQKGVYYSPTPEFCGYDIYIFSQSKPEGFWMNYNDAMKAMKSVGMFYSVPLMEGTIEECLKFDIKINSTVPAQLGLSPLDKNIIEGIVIKTIEPVPIPGSRGVSRAIYKIKNAKFEEINPKIEETIYEKERNKGRNAVEKTYAEIERYINENRLNSVTSKVGPLTKKNMDEVCRLLCEDAFKDFIKDNQETWEAVEEDKQTQIKANTSSKVKAFVTDYMKSNS